MKGFMRELVEATRKGKQPKDGCRGFFGINLSHWYFRWVAIGDAWLLSIAYCIRRLGNCLLRKASINR